MALCTPRARSGLIALGLMAGYMGLSATALAQQSCGEDLKKLTDKRQVELTRINALVAAAKGKPMDPEVFCKQSQGLNSVENALIAYMEKNKDWCGIPDEIVSAMKENHAKSAAFAGKACAVAAKWKKQQEAGGGNGAPQAQPLPTGPL
jgi:hypothetical protein